jgi:hypothetical protein
MEILNTISPYFSVLAIIGTYCLILAYDRAKMPERVKKRGQLAEGTVVEIRRNPGPIFGSQEGEGFAPVVEFATSSGNHRHFSTHYQTPSPYQVGQKVQVGYYFYKSIREVLLDGEENQPSSPTLLICGVCLCLLGYPFVFIKLLGLF